METERQLIMNRAAVTETQGPDSETRRTVTEIRRPISESGRAVTESGPLFDRHPPASARL
jgi:hypothetical protein